MRKAGYALPALLTAGVIFYVSSLEKTELPLEVIFFNDLLFHAAAYFFCGLTLMLAAYLWNASLDYPLRAYIILGLIGVLYGLSDEIHQSFIPDRACTISDFLADSFGVIILHIPGTDGCFYGDGMFRVAPRFETKHLEEIFRHNVFKMLVRLEGSLPRVRSLKIWSACFYHGVIRASTSSVAQGYNPEISKQWKIWPVEPVRRVIRASFSQERMTYIKEESKVSYQSKDGEIIESPKNL